MSVSHRHRARSEESEFFGLITYESYDSDVREAAMTHQIYQACLASGRLTPSDIDKINSGIAVGYVNQDGKILKFEVTEPSQPMSILLQVLEYLLAVELGILVLAVVKHI